MNPKSADRTETDFSRPLTNTDDRGRLLSTTVFFLSTTPPAFDIDSFFFRLPRSTTTTATRIRSFTRTSEVLSVVHRPNWPATWICRTFYGENGVSEFHAPEGSNSWCRYGFIVTCAKSSSIGGAIYVGRENKKKASFWWTLLSDGLSNCRLATIH